MERNPKNVAKMVAHAYAMRELAALATGNTTEAIVVYHTAEVALRAAEEALRVAVLAECPDVTVEDVDVACARLVQAAGVPGSGGYGADYAPVSVPEQW